MTIDVTDHEILILLRQDVIQLNARLQEALQQLARGNSRFEHITLKEQEVAISLTSLRSDFSRSLLQSDVAIRKSEEAISLAKMLSRDVNSQSKDMIKTYDQIDSMDIRLEELQDEFNKWKTYAKIIGVVFSIIQVILIPLAIKAIEQFLFK